MLESSGGGSSSSSILFESPDKSVVVMDIPRSIEEAQVLPGKATDTARRLRLVSARPVEKPWPTPEPRDGGGGSDGITMSMSHSAAIAELMTLEAVRVALDTVRSSYSGPWCLPRVVLGESTGSGDGGGDSGINEDDGENDRSEKRGKRHHPPSLSMDEEGKEEADVAIAVSSSELVRNGQHKQQTSTENASSTQSLTPSLTPPPLPDHQTPFLIPERSHHLLGTISAQRSAFLATALAFDLIVLDPPWPSRSARRKRKNHSRNHHPSSPSSNSGYATVRDVQGARALLSQIPIASHLKPDGLVAIWITNKAAVADLLFAPSPSPSTGTGAQPPLWGDFLEPVGEWIWLKVTAAGGEPVVDPEARWRKPWERLVIARRMGSRVSLSGTGSGSGSGNIDHNSSSNSNNSSSNSNAPTSAPSSSSSSYQRRVILAVPDVHSRKPNLRGLFADLNVLPEGYAGLEVFARNLTAGWWGWGDEVLRFQERRHWVDEDG
ncbi:hypothetical protein SLS62_006498 [Diatrype stigma]|uniref:MT-A70-domain-containing protein n=1 Tax=Diatrype stigma TaxID=117547 RepID=A0AAN9YMS0_9PEZI